MKTKDSKIIVRLIKNQDTLFLRQKVLKPHLSLEECINPGDDSSNTFHFAAFSNDNNSEEKMKAIASFIAEDHPLNNSAKNPYRLRGMATDFDSHGCGYGAAVLQGGLEYIQTTQNCEFVWCNAREVAFGFYEKMGFKTYAEMFEISGSGPHKIMYKYLNPR